jgi:steroid 5-alpha reductase family enzyme
MENFIFLLGLAVGINILMFIPAFLFKTDKLTDISYAASFLILASIVASQSTQELGHILLYAFVTLWSIRLGGFLLYRINKQGRDKRFDEMRSKFFSFLKFWLLQGVSVFVILIPALLYWQNENLNYNTLSVIGAIIFIIGLSVEFLADIQKFNFNQRKNKSTAWIDEGLWSRSRHPNYFGEISVWFGIYLFVLPSLSLNQALIGLIGPLFITSLLLFVSGIPLLEKSADKKWGNKKRYQEYKKRTPVLIPKLSKKQQ